MKKKYIAKILMTLMLLQATTPFIANAESVEITSAYINIENLSVEELVENVQYSKNEILNLDAQIAKQLSLIGSKEKELKKENINNAMLEERYTLMLKSAYKSNNANELYSLICLASSKDLKCFLNNLDVVNKIMIANEMVLAEYKNSNLQVKNLKIDISKEKELLEKNKKEKESKEKELAFKKEVLTKKMHINKKSKEASETILKKLNFDSIPKKNKEIIDYALQFLGMPYLWGGDNPNISFDCSGLVQYSYGKFGIQLPRVSQDQQNVGTPISRTELIPGDLVFYGTPATHIAIYLGDGYILEAPQTGDFIKVTSMRSPTNYKRVID